MSVKDIYLKTMKFVWLKFAFGAAFTLAAAVLFAIMVGIAALISADVGIITAFIWLGLTCGGYRLAMYYVGYLIKAGHIAVIAKAVTDGTIPENQFEWGKEAVKSRFVAANVYFLIDRLVDGAVRQLQRLVSAIGGIFKNVPVVGTIVSLVQKFIEIFVGYIDECCLAYTFLHPEQSAFKAACDGVCIYYENAKHLMKNALKTTIIVSVATLLAFILPLVLFVLIFKALEWSVLVAVILALMLAAFIKSAFIDSYMMVEMMVAYMRIVPETAVNSALYDKLCKLSGKFKKLFKQAENEPVPTAQ